jgi:Uma2 family endonuclease
VNIRVSRVAEGLDRRAFTIADFERMVEAGVIGHDERLELLGGELVPMSPEGSRHEAIKVALARYWGRVCPVDHVVAQETGLRLDEYTYLEPDFVVFQRTVRLADLKGPDILLAVEVADSSLSYDLRRKPMIYAGFGVQELWVIDAGRRVIHRHASSGSAGYARIEEVGAAEVVIPLYAPAAFAFALNALEAI